MMVDSGEPSGRSQPSRWERDHDMPYPRRQRPFAGTAFFCRRRTFFTDAHCSFPDRWNSL